ncbi:leucine carboxyl methyltransferase 1-like [Tropilaelaps mercedesae]|uniref:Leucine carboxyl methyltransferase 1 n=1 Tax=Tropilaelaps mercedesae TaxID=418985 RepID=A0A1V9Y1S6_9ACAR|nr:leucine carboxyl methyltransferase 1-like [Tropilaelaps mercedesae]
MTDTYVGATTPSPTASTGGLATSPLCSGPQRQADEPVMQTNDDATACKRAAVERGYWMDPYVQHFIKHGDRKPPEINRGYFARVQAIKMLVDKFLEIASSQAQIVSLGAGFDTLFWRLQEENRPLKAFVEVDFPPVTMRKVHYIRLRKTLLEKIASNEDDDIRLSKCDIHSSRYHLVGVDMKNLQTLAAKLSQDCRLDPQLPTLFITECVLVYMAPSDCEALLSYITSTFKKAVLLNYDPVNMNDKFAEVMLENLKHRDCHFLGLEAAQDLISQEARLLRCGFPHVRSWLMLQVYQALPSAELKRIEALELMDEHELLQQLLNHYCISVADNCAPALGYGEVRLHPVSTVTI